MSGFVSKRRAQKKVGGAPLLSSALDTSTSLGDSDVKVPSQKAVKQYVQDNSGGIKKSMSIAATF